MDLYIYVKQIFEKVQKQFSGERVVFCTTYQQKDWIYTCKKYIHTYIYTSVHSLQHIQIFTQM